MRATLNLPEDVYQLARALAELRRISLGDAVAELVRRGTRSPVPIDTATPFPSFVLPPDAKPITLEDALAAEDEL
jgi:hypothetical protein